MQVTGLVQPLSVTVTATATAAVHSHITVTDGENMLSSGSGPSPDPQNKFYLLTLTRESMLIVLKIILDFTVEISVLG